MARRTSLILGAGAIRLLDEGPVRHSDILRFDDADVETGLEQSGFTAERAAYRLIEIDLAEIEDTASFPLPWHPTDIQGRIRAGAVLPPIVVARTDRGRGFGLIDGLNRAYPQWLERMPTIRAYELLVG